MFPFCSAFRAGVFKKPMIALSAFVLLAACFSASYAIPKERTPYVIPGDQDDVGGYKEFDARGMPLLTNDPLAHPNNENPEISMRVFRLYKWVLNEIRIVIQK